MSGRPADRPTPTVITANALLRGWNSAARAFFRRDPRGGEPPAGGWKTVLANACDIFIEPEGAVSPDWTADASLAEMLGRVECDESADEVHFMRSLQCVFRHRAITSETAAKFVARYTQSYLVKMVQRDSYKIFIGRGARVHSLWREDASLSVMLERAKAIQRLLLAPGFTKEDLLVASLEYVFQRRGITCCTAEQFVQTYSQALLSEAVKWMTAGLRDMGVECIVRGDGFGVLIE